MSFKYDIIIIITTVQYYHYYHCHYFISSMSFKSLQSTSTALLHPFFPAKEILDHSLSTVQLFVHLYSKFAPPPPLLAQNPPYISYHTTVTFPSGTVPVDSTVLDRAGLRCTAIKSTALAPPTHAISGSQVFTKGKKKERKKSSGDGLLLASSQGIIYKISPPLGGYVGSHKLVSAIWSACQIKPIPGWRRWWWWRSPRGGIQSTGASTSITSGIWNQLSLIRRKWVR